MSILSFKVPILSMLFHAPKQQFNDWLRPVYYNRDLLEIFVGFAGRGWALLGPFEENIRVWGVGFGFWQEELISLSHDGNTIQGCYMLSLSRYHQSQYLI